MSKQMHELRVTSPQHKGEIMKSMFCSKTFWTNVLAIIAMVAQGITGKEILPLELQTAILGLINIALRSITKEPVTWN